MAEYGWMIIRDFITPYDVTGRSMVGICGPSGISDEARVRLKEHEGKLFRMYDDDGNVYVEGRYLGPEGELEFAPKDEYGEPSLGCTEIRYFEKGGWVTL